jgi:hypothetical protein
VTSTCFRQSKKSSHGFSWLTSPVFWMPAKDFGGSGSTRIEIRISVLGAPNSRSKWRQWRLC